MVVSHSSEPRDEKCINGTALNAFIGMIVQWHSGGERFSSFITRILSPQRRGTSLTKAKWNENQLISRKTAFSGAFQSHKPKQILPKKCSRRVSPTDDTGIEVEALLDPVIATKNPQKRPFWESSRALMGSACTSMSPPVPSLNEMRWQGSQSQWTSFFWTIKENFFEKKNLRQKRENCFQTSVFMPSDGTLSNLQKARRFIEYRISVRVGFLSSGTNLWVRRCHLWAFDGHVQEAHISWFLFLYFSFFSRR